MWQKQDQMVKFVSGQVLGSIIKASLKDDKIKECCIKWASFSIGAPPDAKGYTQKVVHLGCFEKKNF